MGRHRQRQHDQPRERRPPTHAAPAPARPSARRRRDAARAVPPQDRQRHDAEQRLEQLDLEGQPDQRAGQRRCCRVAAVAQPAGGDGERGHQQRGHDRVHRVAARRDAPRPAARPARARAGQRGARAEERAQQVVERTRRPASRRAPRAAAAPVGVNPSTLRRWRPGATGRPAACRSPGAPTGRTRRPGSRATTGPCCAPPRRRTGPAACGQARRAAARPPARRRRRPPGDAPDRAQPSDPRARGARRPATWLAGAALTTLTSRRAPPADAGIGVRRRRAARAQQRPPLAEGAQHDARVAAARLARGPRPVVHADLGDPPPGALGADQQLGGDHRPVADQRQRAQRLAAHQLERAVDVAHGRRRSCGARARSTRAPPRGGAPGRRGRSGSRPPARGRARAARSPRARARSNCRSPSVSSTQSPRVAAMPERSAAP